MMQSVRFLPSSRPENSSNPLAYILRKCHAVDGFALCKAGTDATALEEAVFSASK
jgi:hypothetical protein